MWRVLWWGGDVSLIESLADLGLVEQMLVDLLDVFLADLQHAQPFVVDLNLLLLVGANLFIQSLLFGLTLCIAQSLQATRCLNSSSIALRPTMKFSTSLKVSLPSYSSIC